MHGVHIAALLLERVLGLSELGGKLIPGHLSKDIVLARTVLLDGLSGLDEHAKRLEIGGGVCIKKSKLGCSGVSVVRLNPNELDRLHVLLLVEGDGDGIRSGDLEIARLDLGEVLAVRAHLDAILLDVAIGTGLARRVDNALDAHGVGRGQRQPVLTGRDVPIAVPNGGQFAIKHVLGVGAILLVIRCGGSERRRIDEVQVAAGLDLELVECGHNSGLVGVNRGLHALGQILANLGPSGLKAGNGLLGEQAVEQGSGIAVELELRIGVQAAVVGNLIGGLAILAGQQGLDLGNEAVDVGLNRVGVQEQGVSLVQELTQTGDVLPSEDGLGGDDSVVELHGGGELTGGGDADIVHVALERAGGRSNALNGKHEGGLERLALDGFAIAERVDERAVHVQRSLLELILDLELDPLVHGQGVVEGIGAVLAGKANLTGALLNGHDRTVIGFEQDLRIHGGAGALHLHAKVVAQANGRESVVLDRRERLAAVKLEGLFAIDVLDSGVLARHEVAAELGGILQRVHRPMGDNTVLIGGNLVPKVDIRGVAQLGDNSLGASRVKLALAPGVGGKEAERMVDAVVDVVLGNTVLQIVAHVVPHGIGAADHLRIARRNSHAADGVQLIGIGRIAQVVVVVAGVRHDVENAVLAVDQVEAELVHLLEIGPTGVPQVHLATMLAVLGHALDLDIALDGAQRTPHAGLLAVVLAVLEHVVHKFAVRVSIRGVLVGAHVNRVRTREHGRIAALDVLIKDAAHELEALIILLGDIQVIVLATVRTMAQIRTDLGESQGVGRGIDFGDDVHAESLGLLDIGLEVLLAVPNVLGGQVGLVLAVVAALLDVGLETERRVGLENVLVLIGVVLKRNEVVVQVDLEVVHLVERHLLGHLLQPVEGEGLASHVQDDAAHLVERVVAGRTEREGAGTGLHALQDRLTAPVGTGNSLGRHGHPIRGYVE